VNLQQFGRRPAQKLNAWDVHQIRQWVRRDGFGLQLEDQIRALEAVYPQVRPHTLRDVVRGDSWRDPAYDRFTPLDPEPENRAQASWFLWLVMWVWLHRHSSTSLDFLPLLPGVSCDQTAP